MASDISWISQANSRRASVETVFSIQGKETDFVQDTTDTESGGGDSRDSEPEEFEPVTGSEEDEVPGIEDASSDCEDGIISTHVIEVSVGDDGDLELADSESTSSGSEGDSEMDLFDYWRCAQCHATNNNPLYRYCERCFRVRKNFFPPRPKRKRKPNPTNKIKDFLTQSTHDSGVESAPCYSQSTDTDYLGSQTSSLSQSTQSNQDNSQTLQDNSQTSQDNSQSLQDNSQTTVNEKVSLLRATLKRRAESVDTNGKRTRTDRSDNESDEKSETSQVAPLVKTTSDPLITLDPGKSEPIDSSSLCIVCVSEPKSGVFVHGRIAHICCCYRCAVKVWAKTKRCPLCNCKVSNVLRAVVM